MAFEAIKNLFTKEDAMKRYASMQYLIKNEIVRAIAEDRKTRVFTAFDLPTHSHTGTDSPQVAYTSLAGAQYIALIRSFTLTSAQILALNTTPIEILPPPDALNVYIVEGVTARIIYGGTAYTGANALEIRYTNASGAKVVADIPAAFLNSSASAWSHSPAVTTNFTPVAGGSSSNGRIVAVVPTADPGTGNSTIQLTIKYRVVGART